MPHFVQVQRNDTSEKVKKVSSIGKDEAANKNVSCDFPLNFLVFRQEAFPFLSFSHD